MSVDIDLSYIGEVVYEDLADVRERALAEVRKCAEQLGYSPSYGKGQHAGRTIRLPYDSGQVKVDVNFMNRVTLFDEVELKSSIDPSMSFKTLSPYDLFGGKVRALLGRATVRDLYDIKTIFEGMGRFDEEKAHASFLLYASLADLFPHAFEKSFTDGFDERFSLSDEDVERDLVPMLRYEEKAPSVDELKDCAKEFVREMVDPRDGIERAYLAQMRGALFSPELILPRQAAERALKFPEALWKVKNLEKYVELPEYGAQPRIARRPAPRASHQESGLEKHSAQSRTRNLSTQQGKGLGPKGR